MPAAVTRVPHSPLSFSSASVDLQQCSVRHLPRQEALDGTMYPEVYSHEDKKRIQAHLQHFPLQFGTKALRLSSAMDAYGFCSEMHILSC